MILKILTVVFKTPIYIYNFLKEPFIDPNEFNNDLDYYPDNFDGHESDNNRINSLQKKVQTNE